jgi:pimeloyl-ACP methyl ester carboxylesterase
MVQGVTSPDFSYAEFVNDYDEFAFFDETLAEWDLHVPVPPVRRGFVAVEGLRQLSALTWGEGPAELVLLHGGAQNAHTYDTLALILQRPLVALDLPHHGHSDASAYGRFAVTEHAADVAAAIAQLITPPRPLVGMSYGGLLGIAVAHTHPELVSQLILIDITPGVGDGRGSLVQDFINGPESFASFDELLARTIEYNPGRSESSLRRGILHNAVQRDDGTWVWRHQRAAARLEPDNDVPLWQWLHEITVPVTLIRALGPTSVVTDDDVAEFRRRRPEDDVIDVDGASHSIQGSHPLALADILIARCDARSASTRDRV